MNPVETSAPLLKNRTYNIFVNHTQKPTPTWGLMGKVYFKPPTFLPFPEEEEEELEIDALPTFLAKRIFQFDANYSTNADVNSTRRVANNNNEPYYYNVFDKLDFTLSGLAIILNVLLLLFILTHRRLRKTTCSKFFMNLQAVHLFMCANALTVDDYGIGYAQLYVSNGLLMELFLALLLTTLDRLAAIKYPYFYQRVTTRWIAAIIGVSWLPGVVFVVILLSINAHQVVMVWMFTILIAVAMVILVCSNTTIWMIVRKHIRAVQRNCRPSVSDINDDKAKVKATFVCLSIVATFVLFWLPHLVHNLIYLTSVLPYGVFTRSLGSMILLNAMIDPCLYVVFRKDVKKEIKLLVRKHHPSREPESRSSYA